MTAIEHDRPPSRTFTYGASSQRYGIAVPSRRPLAERRPPARRARRRPADLALADARAMPKRLHERFHLARAHALDVGLLDDRHQRLLGPPPRLEQRAGKKSPARSLGMRSSSVPTRVSQRAAGSRCAGCSARASARSAPPRSGPPPRPPSAPGPPSAGFTGHVGSRIAAAACSRRVSSAILWSVIADLFQSERQTSLEDHAVALAVKGLDLHHSRDTTEEWGRRAWFGV